MCRSGATDPAVSAAGTTSDRVRPPPPRAPVCWSGLGAHGSPLVQPALPGAGCAAQPSAPALLTEITEGGGGITAIPGQLATQGTRWARVTQ